MGSADQRFSLRWNNYQSHLVTAFESLLEENEFVDVTLGVEGKKLPAHKMLLSACSPYFRDLLKGNPCQHPIIILRDIKYDDLQSLLQFMYNGEVNVAQEQLNSFLKTAESLKIRGLTDSTEESGQTENNTNTGGSSSGSRPPVRDRLAEERQEEPLAPPPAKKKRPYPDPHLPNPDHRLKPPAPSQPRPPPPPVVAQEPVKQEVIDIGDEGDMDTPDNGYGDSDRGGGGETALANISTGYEHESYDNSLAVQDGAMGMDGDASQGWSDEEFGPSGVPYRTSAKFRNSILTSPSLSSPRYVNIGFSPGQVDCPTCGRIFGSRRAWRNHNVVHEVEGGRLLCKVCGKQQSSGTNYRRHLKTSHGMDGDPFS